MSIKVEDLARIVDNIWGTFLGSNVERTEHGTPLEGNEFTLVGCIQITGAWEGTTVMHCSQTSARLAVAKMFNENPDDVTAEQIEDAIYELTNMTAGNVKTLLPGPARLLKICSAQDLFFQTTIPYKRQPDAGLRLLPDILQQNRLYTH